jgi:hypothetical protein
MLKKHQNKRPANLALFSKFHVASNFAAGLLGSWGRGGGTGCYRYPSRAYYGKLPYMCFRYSYVAQLAPWYVFSYV